MHKDEKLDMVEALINAKGNVAIGDDTGCEPLHIACAMGHVKIAKTLCESNANVSAQNIYSVTPLMLAVDQGSAKVFVLLQLCLTREGPAPFFFT